MIFLGPQDRAYLVFSLLDGFSIVLFELGLKVASPHFDAQLSPRPNISNSFHDFILVQRGYKVVNTYLRSSRVLGLTLLISASQIPHR